VRGLGAALGLALIGAASLRPEWLRGPYDIWAALARVLSRVTAPLLLGVLYVLIVLPLGLLHRVRGGWRSAPWPPAEGASTWRARAEDPDRRSRYDQQF
jgi:hypothetical protein